MTAEERETREASSCGARRAGRRVGQMAQFWSVTFALLWGCCGTVGPSWADVDDRNVVIILDASGSMGSKMRGASITKMAAAKRALIQVLKQVPQDTHIGLLVFSAKQPAQEWLYSLGPREDSRLVAAIEAVQPGYKTPLGAYIKKGADRLLDQRAKQYGYGTYRLLIVTDGEADDPSLVNSYVPEVISRGITVDVIGVDMNVAHTLATKVHSYRSANAPESLTKAIEEVFAEVADSGTDAAGEDAFDQLRAIPDELANEMLKAISTSGNHPIGSQPGETVPSDEEARRGQNQSGSQAGGSRLPVVLFFVIVAAFVVLSSRAKKKR